MTMLRRGKYWILRVNSDELIQVYGTNIDMTHKISGPIECWYLDHTTYVKWFYDIWFDNKEELVEWRLVNSF